MQALLNHTAKMTQLIRHSPHTTQLIRTFAYKTNAHKTKKSNKSQTQIANEPYNPFVHYRAPNYAVKYNIPSDYNSDLLSIDRTSGQFMRNTLIEWQTDRYSGKYSKLAAQSSPTESRQRKKRAATKRFETNSLLYLLRAVLYKKILGRLL